MDPVHSFKFLLMDLVKWKFGSDIREWEIKRKWETSISEHFHLRFSGLRLGLEFEFLLGLSLGLISE